MPVFPQHLHVIGAFLFVHREAAHKLAHRGKGTLTGGRRVRITAAFIRDLADRLLAYAYSSLPVSPSVRDALYDFSREGSFAAMRELVRRFPMDEFERSCYVQVLSENEQLE